MSIKTDLNVRTAEVWKNESWQPILLLDVRKGDTFRLFEPDGSPCCTTSADGRLQCEYIAKSDGFLDESTGLYGIQI